jgi:hypothetical protein
MNTGEIAELELKIPVHWAFRWICIFGIVFFLWMAFLSQLNKEGVGYSLTFIGLSLLEFLGLLLSFSTIEVNQKSIVTNILFTTHRIDWDEVKTIETDIARLLAIINKSNRDNSKTIKRKGSNIAFLGGDKYFPIQLAIAGKEKKELLKFLEELIDRRQIEVKPLLSSLKKHKNTRIKSNKS